MTSIERGSPGPAGRAAAPGKPSRRAAQPVLGLLGLLLVVPIAVVLAVGAGGDGSVLVLGPFITFGLPLVAMVAFWWDDWPGTRLRAAWSGWADTALIVAGAVVSAGLGQVVVGGFDAAALFGADAGPGHVPAFPATLPLAGAAFVTMLQITLVGEGRPLRRLPPLPAGLLAVAASWVIALVVFATLVRIDPPAGSGVIARHGPVPGADAGAALITIGAGQLLIYVVWHGRPISAIAARRVRLTTAHVSVLAAGILTYLVARGPLGLPAGRIAAIAGCFIAAGLLVGMLFEDSVRGRLMPLVLTLALTALLAAGLDVIAGTLHLSRVGADDWVAHASLNALSTSIILHVAIGRRWPFARTSTGRE